MAKGKQKYVKEKDRGIFYEYAHGLKQHTVKELLKLSTGGFGLVAALAWNELIKALVSDYIEPFVGKDSGIISLLIYALIVTFLAIVVTYNLSKLIRKPQSK